MLWTRAAIIEKLTTSNASKTMRSGTHRRSITYKYASDYRSLRIAISEEVESLRIKTAVLASLITAAVLASALLPATRVRGFIPEPYELYGVAKQESGAVLTDGSPIRTFVDGAEFSNKTSVFSRPANTDGYFDVDTFGNYMTNLTDRGTPEVKEGANVGENIMYTWGDMSNNTQLDVTKPWLTGVVFNENHTWQTGLPPQAGDLNAAPAAQQPPLLKVLIIVTHSNIRPFTDYMYLCNPTDALVDSSKFYIEKDVLGNIHGPNVTTLSGVIPPRGGQLYVNLNSPDYFVETGDNVKLVWKNTGTSFGGNDVIVDRVEFNRTGGTGTLYWEPGNTIQPDEMAPDAGMQINRSATCRDTNSAVQDFFTTTELGPANAPPNAPWPLTIATYDSDTYNNSAVIFHFTKTGPTSFQLGWHHSDPNLDPQAQADVAIYDGPGRTGTGWFNIIPGSAQTTTYPGGLLPCKDYYYSVRTRDQAVPGPYAEWHFHTNCLPTTPTHLTPADQSTVPTSTTQKVTWTASTDADADPLTYHYQVGDGTFTTILAERDVTQTNSTNFTTTPGTYYWHVSVNDTWQTIAYTFPWRFTAAPATIAPSMDTLTVDTYSSGLRLSHILTATPTLAWAYHDNGAGKPQSQFDVEVKRLSDSFVMWNYTGSGTASSIVYGSAGSASALVQSVNYTYHVRGANVQNSSTVWGDWSAALTFRVNTPPPVPTTPVAPTPGGTVAVGSTMVMWTEGLDAEQDTITFDYCVGTTNPPTGCTAPWGGIGVGNNASSAFTTVIGTHYYWYARANDSFQLSAWSVVWDFSTPAPPNTAPTISIQTPTAGQALTQGDNFNITWIMHDNEEPNANLTVRLVYSVGTGSPVVIVAAQKGLTYFVWTVPNIEGTNIVINATVTDTPGLHGWSETQQFTVQKKTETTGGDLTTILMIVVIIIVVVVLLLVLLMMRRKKKPAEEEEAGAPAAEETTEEAPAEEELVEEEAPPAPPPRAAAPPVAAAAAKPAAKGPAKTKECANCGTIVSVTDKECFMCGAKL